MDTDIFCYVCYIKFIKETFLKGAILKIMTYFINI